ncbi:MAG: FAD-dependent oxidoreductase [Lentisphaerae bacterium]|jgi:NADH-quinone oxidoreductase subunit F|nr:FAD-dependent oxidoreductase [Lentisphaerota bacterium]MBT5612245.1 FAD-dependent oxidoreductase [Lentisphaerota bacterium]MBT7060777.1 FAD-dependent oxidoreductase [Lentisphaerota bacterium]MBT7845224.1 FAD-dependent oxidoreductase [Lentisphaerota bacterium]
MSTFRAQVLLCAGGACISSGSESVRDAFLRELEHHGLTQEIDVITTGCMGMCEIGPIAVIYPEGVFYQKVTAEDVTEIVEEHLLKGRVVDRLFYKQPSTDELVQAISEIDFFKLQKKIALQNCGSINPEEIREYIAAGGYEALGKTLTEMTPTQVTDEVQASGLRGRGGAGFPTGLKWSFTAREESEKKYVVCNADEGDPGAFMDRSILEGDPHSVIEAMAICGYSIGSDQGYIYVRAEYPLAIERLNTALKQARELGLLGTDIFSSGFDFDIEIRMGAGAFVCGEETALMHSIEGKRGEPRPKPPFPAQKGLFNKPTVLNNVETYANIPYIILNGGEEFAKVGSGKSKGTKVFALAGDINNSGLVEVPMGMTLGTIVYDIGGGIPGNRAFKAVQIGGPSGGCIPKEYLNTPVTYESLPDLGAIMGSGGLIVMNEDTCMVDLARYFMEFIQEESCGKCTPCRIGSKIMLHLLTKICDGKGTMADLARLEELADQVKQTALCGLGQTAPNPVISTLRYFREEYIEHIQEQHCRAGVCNAMVKAPCINACPACVNVPAYLAFTKEERFDDALAVHLRSNPFPSVCGRVCPQFCVKKCRRNDLEGPLGVRAVKRFMADLRDDYSDLFPAKADANGKKIAVVGAGPAGLTGACYLQILGYDVTVFEKQPEAGGMLRYAIPDYRLPREDLASEIANIEKLGVTIKTSVAIGKDVTVEQLKSDGYDAVFVSTGAGKQIKPDLPGVELPGVLSGVEFLEMTSKGDTVDLGRNVIVIGGGDVAIDCSRVALRCGAENVRVVYRRTREEMPTQDHEISEAEKEGVEVQYLANLVGVKNTETGLLATIRSMRLGEFDRSGRRRPVPIETSDVDQPVDAIILAIGQRPEASAVFAGAGMDELVDGDWINASEKDGTTKRTDIFAGGDLVTGPATVVEAIAAGQRAAKSIDQLLLPGDKEYFWETIELPDVFVDTEAELEEVDPVAMPMLPAGKRTPGAEVEGTVTAEEAIREACRCLRCDYKG